MLLTPNFRSLPSDPEQDGDRGSQVGRSSDSIWHSVSMHAASMVSEEDGRVGTETCDRADYDCGLHAKVWPPALAYRRGGHFHANEDNGRVPEGNNSGKGQCVLSSHQTVKT